MCGASTFDKYFDVNIEFLKLHLHCHSWQHCQLQNVSDRSQSWNYLGSFRSMTTNKINPVVLSCCARSQGKNSFGCRRLRFGIWQCDKLCQCKWSFKNITLQQQKHLLHLQRHLPWGKPFFLYILHLHLQNIYIKVNRIYFFLFWFFFENCQSRDCASKLFVWNLYFWWIS